jgi:hypothetical protein
MLIKTGVAIAGAAAASLTLSTSIAHADEQGYYVHDQSGLDATTSFNVLMESMQQDCPASTPSMVKWERGLREAGALPPVGN